MKEKENAKVKVTVHKMLSEETEPDVKFMGVVNIINYLAHTIAYDIEKEAITNYTQSAALVIVGLTGEMFKSWNEQMKEE